MQIIGRWSPGMNTHTHTQRQAGRQAGVASREPSVGPIPRERLGWGIDERVRAGGGGERPEGPTKIESHPDCLPACLPAEMTMLLPLTGALWSFI